MSRAAGFTTFEGLILRVATEAGLHYIPPKSVNGDNRPQIPQDRNILDRVARAINDGRREVRRRMPTARCFRPRLSIVLSPDGTSPANIDNDPAKVALPFAGAVPRGRWTWTMGSGYGGNLEFRLEQDISELAINQSSITGATTPRFAALCTRFVSAGAISGQRTQTYLWLFPPPADAYTISGEAMIGFAPLAALDDIDPMGDEHVPTIVAAAMLEMNRNNPSLAVRESLEARLNTAIALSVLNDQQRIPHNIGVSTDPDAALTTHSLDPAQLGDLSNMCSTVNGVSVL